MTPSKLFEKIENSPSIDFGDIFSNSIELFKKVWMQGFLHLLITFVLVLPLIFVIYIPIFALAGLADYEGGNSFGEFPSEELSVGLMILFGVFVLLISIISTALQFGITAHFYRVCKQVDLGQPETSSYFMFLKGKYFGKVLVLGISMFGIFLLATVLCYFPIFYVMVPLQLLGAIFAFNPDLNVNDLIKASFKLGNKIWLIAFGLILISSLLSQLTGVLLCFVGVFFTASFVYLPIYYMYKNTIGFDTEETEE